MQACEMFWFFLRFSVARQKAKQGKSQLIAFSMVDCGGALFFIEGPFRKTFLSFLLIE